MSEFVDLSSNNATPNLKTMWASGKRVLGLKATEGTTYTWAEGLHLADAWHALGGIVWFYHFGRPGTPVEQARHFLATIKGHTKSGDRLVADCEVAGVNDAWVASFMGTVHAASPLGEEIYGSPYFLRDHGIRPHHGEGLWLAQYAASVSFIPPGWRTWDAWQFSETAVVSGESGKVDESHLAKTLTVQPTHTAWYHRPLRVTAPLTKGADVSHVQSRLIALRFLPARNASGHTNADGIYGNATADAVGKLQRAKHLTPDRVVGPDTARAIG